MYGLYIHWPFCRRKCSYCSFSSTTGAEHSIPAYADALRRELVMRRSGLFSGVPATVYLGGGTPSLVPPESIRFVLEYLAVSSGTECTVEANPDSLTSVWLESLRETGVNRLSIGVQSFDDGLLRSLGRLHRADRAEWAVRMAFDSGFHNISVDLMFGIPGQTIYTWKDTLERALSLPVSHISAYSLGLEEDTPFYERSRQGGLDIPDPEQTSEMYLILSETLRNHGFERYEVSNFARPGYECLHNIGYWNHTPYLGVGVSAHSHENGRRWWNVTDLDRYLHLLSSGLDPMEGEERGGRDSHAFEELMLGMRRREGVDLNGYYRRFPERRAGMEPRVASLAEQGLLLMCSDGRITLSDQGFLIMDEILSELMVE